MTFIFVVGILGMMTLLLSLILTQDFTSFKKKTVFICNGCQYICLNLGVSLKISFLIFSESDWNLVTQYLSSKQCFSFICFQHFSWILEDLFAPCKTFFFVSKIAFRLFSFDFRNLGFNHSTWPHLTFKLSWNSLSSTSYMNFIFWTLFFKVLLHFLSGLFLFSLE